MTDYFVDATTGSDAGVGTSGDPWQTLQKGIDDSDGGDTLNLSNDGAFVLSSEITWTLHGSATANSSSAQLVIRSWDNGGALVINHAGGVTRVAAEIDGNDAVAGIFSVTSIPAYVNFLDIRFRRSTGNMNGHNNWRAKFCEFTDMGGTYMALLLPFFCWFHDDGGTSVNGFQNVATSLFNFFDSLSGEGVSSGNDNGVIAGNIFKAMGEDNSPGDDFMNFICNTFIGKGAGETLTGLNINDNALHSMVIGNIFENYAGTGGIGCEYGTETAVSLLNSFFNNSTDSTDTPQLNAENTEPESSDPLVDHANDDFRVVDGAAAEKVVPAYPGSSSDMAFMNAGAVQNDPDAGGGGAGISAGRGFMRGVA